MPRAEPITVYVADDHPVFREALSRAVKQHPDFELVGATGDGREALDGIGETRPAVAIVDQNLPSLAGVEIVRAISRDAVPSRVIMLSGDDSSALVYDAMQLGAAGFMTKTATLAAICDAILAVARGSTVLAPEVQAGFIAEMRARSAPDRPILSERESQVLALIADGLSAPQIGAQLFISSSTVKSHIKNVFEKLGVSDRAAAVAEGMRRGLLQ